MTAFTRNTKPYGGYLLECELIDGDKRTRIQADGFIGRVRVMRSMGPDNITLQIFTAAQARALAAELLACVYALEDGGQ